MIRTRSYKKYLSLLLIIIFIGPIAIKATHRLFIHHEHSTISISDKQEINTSHNHCPICAFEFVEFIDSDNQPLLKNNEYLYAYYSVYIQKEIALNTFYSISLRAPPVKG